METKTVDREAVLNSLNQSDPNTEGQPRKRRRLDNLSSEERALRRKLKNRVAAQTARDRKKARMTDLEEAVESLEKENKAIRLQNQRLMKQTQNLSQEVRDLRVRLGVTPPVSPDSQSLPPSPVQSPQPQETKSKDSQVVIKKETEFTEYASLTVSQQQRHLILFVSMITTWLLVNNSLNSLLACLSLLSKLGPLHSSFSQKKKTSCPQLVASTTSQTVTNKTSALLNKPTKNAGVT